MTVLVVSSAAIFGAIIGSFLNALSFRFNTGRSVAKGRSRCMHCGHMLGMLDLVPIFSFIFLRGRCRYCHAKLSIQYPLVEGAMALLSLLIFLKHPDLVLFLFWTTFWAILLFIVVYDFKHTIIPWTFSISLALLAFISLYLDPASSMLDLRNPTVWALLAGPILALPLFLLSLVSQGRWMGWGDSLLELSLGWVLGLSLGLSALMLAFWSGALIGLFLILLSRWKALATRFTISSEIPFAPFLALGAFLAYFFHVDFFATIPLLWL